MTDITALLGGNDEFDAVIKENLEKRILIFNSEVDDSIIESYLMYILKWNMEDAAIEDVNKRRKIIMLINSGGGDTFSGFNAIDVIENSKTPIVTVCMGMAASMAYHIFICGKKRYAFRNSTFLQHDGELALSNSTSKARDTMKFFEKMEDRTKVHVLAHTNMTEEFYDSHYDQEYWMYADEAKSLGCVDYIIGEDCTLDDIFG